MLTGRRTNWHDEANSRFSQICERAFKKSKIIKTKNRIKYRQGFKAADFKDAKLEYSCMCDAVFNALPILSLEKV
jgi:hypothetical protein